MRDTLFFPYHRHVAGQSTLSFDGWTVDLNSGELSRAGHAQRLAPQPLAMLTVLLTHPGEVVSRDQLVKVLWPKGIVDFDNSLNAVVRKLRVALRDDAGAPRYIETLPRIGFRFVGTLAPAELPTQMPATPGLWRGQRFRAAGVMVLIAVVAAMAAWQFTRPDAIVTRTESVANPLPRHVTSNRARDLYLQARFHTSRRDIDGADLAIASFEAALREDPYFAEGWASLAEAWSGTGMTLKVPVSTAYAASRKAALRALELDSQLSAAHSVLGQILAHYDRNFPQAERELTHALQLDGSNAWAWHHMGLLRAYEGLVPEAFEALRRAREVQPTMPLFSQNYGMLLYHSRRYEEAMAYAQSLLASQPRFDQARSVLIRSLVAKGEAKAALEQLALRQSGRQSPSDAGLVYAHLGQIEEARSEIKRLERIGQQGFGMHYDMAVIQAALGDTKAGCEALQRAVTDHSLTLPWMRLDPRMDPLRNEPCFAKVQQEIYQ